MLNYVCIFKSILNAFFSLLHRLIVKCKIPNNFKRGSKFFYSKRMYLEW